MKVCSWRSSLSPVRAAELAVLADPRHGRHVAVLAGLEVRTRDGVGRRLPLGVGRLPGSVGRRVVVLVAGGAELSALVERRLRRPHQVESDVIQRAPFELRGRLAFAGRREAIGRLAAMMQGVDLAFVDRVQLVARDADDALRTVQGGRLVERHALGAGILEVLHRGVAGGAEAGLARVVGVLEDVAGAAARRAGAGEQVEHPVVLRAVGVMGGRPLRIALEMTGAALRNVRRIVSRILHRRHELHADVEAGVAVDRRSATDDEVLRRAAQIGDRGGDEDLADRIGDHGEAAIGRREGARGLEIGLEMHIGPPDRRPRIAAPRDAHEAGDVGRCRARGKNERSEEKSACGATGHRMDSKRKKRCRHSPPSPRGRLEPKPLRKVPLPAAAPPLS